MNFLELVKMRYTLRDMNGKAVSTEDLEKILEAGRFAPTAKNSQSQRILVINDESSLAKMRECTPCHFNSSLIMILSYNTDVSGTCDNPIGGESYGEVDVAIVATHMVLQATELGIGSAIIATFDTLKIREFFHFPDNIKPVLVLDFGYPSDNGKPGAFHARRFKISKTVTFNDYANPTNVNES